LKNIRVYKKRIRKRKNKNKSGQRTWNFERRLEGKRKAVAKECLEEMKER